MNPKERAVFILKKFSIGAFQIRITINNKVFIDYSINLDSVWNRHQFQLNFGLHANKKLQKEWKQFGEENFVYEILSTLKQDTETAKRVNYDKEAKELALMIIEDIQPYGENGYM
ncbi:GIY-YIG nuclease family protein [Ulvibacter litoralis]|uniref:GIY-YIG nuclease family protein n=1 Tax=Ulvibacter litoralis TaxID=227084 RepID=UPI00111320F6|nr:GIY-YIG nuclease family protein [Ulvibacter litoralis]